MGEKEGDSMQEEDSRDTEEKAEKWKVKASSSR